jgi:hypothetical protein
MIVEAVDSVDAGACLDAFVEEFSSELPMAAFPRFDYTMGQVKRAGEALKGQILWDESRREEILEIFAIANSWRDSHAYPMNRLRQELSGKLKAKKLRGITVARLKRMLSIRGKLARLNANLHQIQDLGGCRVILPSITNVRELLASYESAPKHDLHSESPYIHKPKRGGYRCHHLIYKFRGEGDSEAFNGRRIEIQVRTRLQHAWATAVEAMGLFRREDLKGGNGDLDWLRFFELMSAEFARAENCPEGPEDYQLPPHSMRVQEIVDLNQKLDALDTLEKMGHVVQYMETHLSGVRAPKHYRIEYNNLSREVKVTPHSEPLEGISENDAAEQRDNVREQSWITTVFIEADRIEDLMIGFPNYFGDVQLFTRNLKDIAAGNGAKEYTMPPQGTVPQKPKERPDLSWLKGSTRRRR